MTFVKFDPEGVQALINNLYAYVEDTDEGAQRDLLGQ